MIIFFGPSGAGKSVQGQILAARKSWRWLSMSQLLRDTGDVELYKTMQEGELVRNDKVDKIISDALSRVSDIDNVVFDGFPRKLEQARWLIDSQPLHAKSIDLVIVLEVPKLELTRRLTLRGRIDDTPEIINERLNTYTTEIDPILNYFIEQGIKIVHIDGLGTVDQVHDRIIKELNLCKLI